MEIKKIIKICLVKMGEKDFLDNPTLTDVQQEIKDKLLSAFNVAYSEAVTDFMPLITKEKVKVVGGEVDCTALSKQMVHPVRLEDARGVKHRYHMMPTFITTDFEGDGVLTYAYAPDEYQFGDTLEDLRFTAETLAEGTLAVYYFASRAFDLASVHEDNFRTAVKKQKYKGREIVLKERRWG